VTATDTYQHHQQQQKHNGYRLIHGVINSLQFLLVASKIFLKSRPKSLNKVLLTGSSKVAVNISYSGYTSLFFRA